jgi:gas vesicle protein
MKMNDVVSSLKGIKSELADVLPPEVIDRVLEGMGLQVRRSSVGAFASGTGIFLAGVIIGGAAALLLAPKAGLELRSDLEDKLDTVIDRLKTMAHLKGEEDDTSTKSATAKGGTTTADKDKNKEGNQSGTRTGGPLHHS